MFYISYKLDHAHVLYFLWGQRLVFLIHLQVVSKNADQYVVTDIGNTFLWINYEPRGLKYIGTLFRLKESSPIRRNHEDDTRSMLMALQVTARVVETWDNFRFAGTKQVQLQYILFGCMLGLGNKVYLDMMWLL